MTTPIEPVMSDGQTSSAAVAPASAWGGVTMDANANADAAAVRPHVWFLTADEVAATRAKLAKLQARAVKKGFTGQLSLDVVPATRTYQSPGGLSVTEHGFDVTITGEPPRYAGWRFVAAVDSVEGRTVLRFPPGAPASIANEEVRAGECDHCHTHRARRSTILVAHDTTHQLVQVGRSCLKDFLGHNTLPVLLTVDDLTGTLHPGQARQPAGWDTVSVLAYAFAVVQAFGWTPTAAAEYGRTPTRTLVQLALTGGQGADQLRTALAPHLTDAHHQATLIRDELLTQLAGRTGYEANLTAVLAADSVTSHHLGLAVSAISAHQRLQADRQRQHDHAHTAAQVEHVGAVGDKITLAGTVTTSLRVDGYTYHSPDQVMLIVDCGTAVAKMTTTASWAYHVQVGDRVSVTGTVKAHTDWRGIKQTVLTRPKLNPTLEAEQQPTLADATTPACWETVPTARLDGAQIARATTSRTPACGVSPSY